MRGPAGDKAEVAAAAIAMGRTWAEAAELAGIGLTALAEWNRSEVFRGRVREVRSKAVDAAIGKMASTLSDCVAFLHLTTGNDADETGDRIKAATALMDRYVKYEEHANLAERVRQLEEVRENELARSSQPPPQGTQEPNVTDADPRLQPIP